MKADVKHVVENFKTTRRHACGLMGLAVSTYRYMPVGKGDQELRGKLVELAGEKPRFGYRRLQVLLQRNGEQVNHKRIWRVYRAAGLSVKRKSENGWCGNDPRSRRRCGRIRSGRWTL